MFRLSPGARAASNNFTFLEKNVLQVRYLALASGKTLLSPQPRLRTGFFSTLHQGRDRIPGDKLLEACTSAGVQK
jgi:hypothetical protein